MKLRGLIILLLFSTCRIFSQATIPVSRTTWSATPTGWTDNLSGTYTSTLTCDGNSNRGKFGANGDFTQVFFSGVPGALSFDLQGNSISSTNSLTVQESPDGTTWNTVATISNISGSCVTYTYALTCTSTYVKWTYSKPASGNLAIDNVSILGGSCGGSTCPVLTGAILNSCDNGVAGCNEGDAEVMFFNTGSYSVTVSSLPAHVLNYYGGVSSYTAGTPNAYTGTFTSNASETATLNSSTGCSGVFIDAVTAGTLPVGATVMMVPSNFCGTNYDFSTLCGSFNPIYVLYFNTTGWSSSGNLSNNQTPSPKPKYMVVDFSSVSGSCGLEYYTFDADTEANGNGAGVAYPNSISTSSVAPTSPSAYTGSSCTLPTVLPVGNVDFRAEASDAQTTYVKFTVTGEASVNKYYVSKSFDGRNFFVIDSKRALNMKEKVSYVTIDKNDVTSNSVVYYRLEEEDINGDRKTIGNCFAELKVTKEILVSCDEDKLVVIMPGAFKSLEILSAEGKNISYLPAIENQLVYEINLSGVSRGFYLLRAIDLNNKITIKKIIH